MPEPAPRADRAVLVWLACIRTATYSGESTHPSITNGFRSHCS